LPQFSLATKGRAQKPLPKSAPVTIAPDVTKLNIEKILQQVQTTSVQPSAEESGIEGTDAVI